MFTPLMVPNASTIYVENNYTIKFVFTSWSPVVANLLLLQIPITTPYAQWKSVVNEVQKMNVSQAINFSTQLAEFNFQPWFTGPYYDTVSPPYVIMHLDPSNLLGMWAKIFPYQTWQDYSPEIVIWYTGGTGQTMNGILAGKVTWTNTGFSPAQLQVLKSYGYQIDLAQSDGVTFLQANPTVYPFNITQVREALAYAYNATEAVDTFNTPGYTMNIPQHWQNALAQYIPIPSWYGKYITNVTYNASFAAQLLRQAGLSFKNGEWYLPNGQQFTATLQVPAGSPATDTIFGNIASQLTEFGIKTTLLLDDPSTYWGTIYPNADFQLALGAGGFPYSYPSAGITFPWWGFVYLIPQPNGWNLMANYPITWPNGTKGVWNYTSWFFTITSYNANTPQYNEAMESYSLFMGQWWPLDPVYASYSPIVWNPSDFNASWPFWKEGYEDCRNSYNYLSDFNLKDIKNRGI